MRLIDNWKNNLTQGERDTVKLYGFGTVLVLVLLVLLVVA